MEQIPRMAMDLGVRRRLTKRQREAYELLAGTPSGLTDAELAAEMDVGDHAVHTLCQRMELGGWARLAGGHRVAVPPGPDEAPSAEEVRDHLLTQHGISAAVSRAVNRHVALHAAGATHSKAA